jgi:hypothetical protein
MSAMTISVAQTHPRAHRRQEVSDRPSQGRSTQTVQPRTIVRATTPPADWRLTDRGIAVVMVIAAMILTVALAVIGVTALRVTGPDYSTDVLKSQHDQH